MGCRVRSPEFSVRVFGTRVVVIVGVFHPSGVTRDSVHHGVPTPGIRQLSGKLIQTLVRSLYLARRLGRPLGYSIFSLIGLQRTLFTIFSLIGLKRTLFTIFSLIGLKRTLLTHILQRL